MQAPFFHNVGLGATHQTWLHLLGQRLLQLIEALPQFWRALKVFYGVGAIAVAALAMAFYVRLEGDTRALAVSNPAPASSEAAALSLRSPTSQVVYVVSSKQQADNLLAFGPPAGSPGQLLPYARVSVLVADTPASDGWARVAMDRAMEAHQTNAGPAIVEFIDLR